MSKTFSSLQYRNYRWWFFGSLITNIGGWMQRIAQDWLVLKELTNGSGWQVGVVTALQFLPSLFLAPYAGVLADRYDPKRMMLGTQVVMMLLAVGLGVDVVTGYVELWHVYLFALVLGVVGTIDNGPRLVFVGELVPPRQLSNAVALNSASFNAARMFGPGIAGLAIAWVGTGEVFFVNAASFLASIAALIAIRRSDLYELHRAPAKRGQIREGFNYVRKRTDIMVIMAVAGVVSMLGLNFQVTIGVMSTNEFGRGPSEFGILGSVMAIGSLAGALTAARKPNPRVRTVVLWAFLFGVAAALCALAPNYWTFGITLILAGYTSLMLITSANSTIQLSTEESFRGRVMSLYTMVFLGVTPFGSTAVGWIADYISPRWSIGVGAIGSIVAAIAAYLWARRNWHLELSYRRSLPFLEVTGPRERHAAREALWGSGEEENPDSQDATEDPADEDGQDA